MHTCAHWMVFFHTAWGSYATRSWTWITTLVRNAGKFIWAVIICPAFRSSTTCGAGGITRQSIRAMAHGMTLRWNCTQSVGPTWVWHTRTERFQDAAWVWITFVAWYTVACFLILSDVALGITATWSGLTKSFRRHCRRHRIIKCMHHIQVIAISEKWSTFRN
jgi:hypothetical protein